MPGVRRIWFLPVALLLFPILVHGQTATVALKPEIAVHGPTLCLGDLADVDSPDSDFASEVSAVSFGYVPLPGSVRRIGRSEILRQLAVAGLDPSRIRFSGARETRALPEVRTLTAAEVESALRAYVTQSLPWKDVEVAILAFRNWQEVTVPEGAVDLRVLRTVRPVSYRNLSLPIEAVRQGKTVLTFWVHAEVRVRATALRAVGKIESGSILGSQDLEFGRAEIKGPLADPILSLAEAEGRVLRRALDSGELITKDALRARILVRAGQAVEIRLATPGVRIRTQGRSESNGDLGDRVRIRHEAFNRVVEARVVGPGVVAIEN